MEMTTTLVDLAVDFSDFTLGPVNVDLPGGCTALLGTNGAGKTTLMRSMLGLEPRASGHLVLGPVRSDSRDDRRKFRSLVGWVPQSPEFPRFVTVGQCLDYAADLKGISRDGRAPAIERAVSITDIGGLRKRQASKLSGGQQRRLAIAQAIIHEPALLVMDEPTAGLDPVQRLEFREWLSVYADAHRILISTHMIEDVEETSTYAVVLHDGQLVYDGTTADLLNKVSAAGGSLDHATAVFLRGLAR